MNIKELKEIIRQVVREEVRNGMSEMLREILTEAVEIASKPELKNVPSSTQSVFRPSVSPASSDGILDLIRETQRSMSRDDYASVVDGNSGVEFSSGITTQASGEMLVESVDDLPAFAKNAKAIFDASFKK